MKNILKLSITILLCTALTACSPKNISVSDAQDATGDTESTLSARLPRTADMGKDYIDSFIFIGESTTYHLKSRGVLTGGRETLQVWAPESGTLNLDTTTAKTKIVFPDTGEKISFFQAAQIKKPRAVIFTFGLNGAVQKASRSERLFADCYLALIEEIKGASPDTVIILQSCFPIAADMDMSNYSVDVAALRDCISLINTWSERLAEREGFYYLNTTEALCGTDGFLKKEFDIGDGHHLTALAYQTILEYIRTHAYTEEL